MRLLSSRRGRSTPSRAPCGTAIAAPLGADAGTSPSSSSGRIKVPSSRLVALSVALLSCTLIGGRCAPRLAEAVESPTGPSAARRTRGATPPQTDSGGADDGVSNYSNDGVGEVGAGEPGRIIRTIHESEEDSIALPEGESAYEEKGEDSSLPYYEPKALKQSPQSTRSDRKQRQKHRQNRQQVQQQHTVGTSREENDVERQRQQNARTVEQINVEGQQHSTQAEYDAYMRWCEKVLGIKSVVEIKEFEYLDHLKIHWEDIAREESEWKGFDWLKKYRGDEANDNYGGGGVEERSTLPVRGLAAKHAIHPGDIVISIPLYSLLSVPTTIDHDPVLSRILGPAARERYGWSEDSSEYELALLVVAVLYHRSLGSDSPLWHYLDVLLDTPVDSFPFLWGDRELRERTGGDAGEGVRNLARGIRQDLREMYDGVMGTLVREGPELFAPPDGYFRDGSGAEGGAVEWTYSFENFRWAFALVISRHHYLPIKDFDHEGESRPLKRPTAKKVETPSQMQETLSTVSEVVPPANQPTDSWVDLAKNEERVVEDDPVSTDDDVAIQSLATKHSFLAPLADLINFGPPCLTGSYNAEEHVFELIATCPFAEGQEVTFWYSGDCSDIIIANFGFLHPLVPLCAPAEDWERTSEEWKEKTEMRERELWEVYRKVDLLKDELAVMESQLISCECEGGERKSQRTVSEPTADANQKLRKEQPHSLRQENGRVRGRINEQEDMAREIMEELG